MQGEADAGSIAVRRALPNFGRRGYPTRKHASWDTSKGGPTFVFGPPRTPSLLSSCHNHRSVSPPNVFLFTLSESLISSSLANAWRSLGYHVLPDSLVGYCLDWNNVRKAIVLEERLSKWPIIFLLQRPLFRPRSVVAFASRSIGSLG